MKYIVTVCAVTTLLVATASCSASHTSTSPVAKPTDSSLVSTAVVSPSSMNQDGQDPMKSGCATDGATVPGSQVDVKLPSGALLGTLVLRNSPSCNADWADVYVPATRPADYGSITIVLSRLSDQKTASFSTTAYGNPIYGSMLSVSQGCVTATATITSPNTVTKSVAKTPCLK